MKDWEALISEYVITKMEMEKLADEKDDAKKIGEDFINMGLTGNVLTSTAFKMIPQVAPILFTLGAIPGATWWLLNKEIAANKMKSEKKLFKVRQMLEEAEGNQ